MSVEFQYDVFLSHSAKDKAVVRASSLSASNGEKAWVRCRSLHFATPLWAEGLKVWFDERVISSPAGCPWPIGWEKVSAGGMRVTGVGLGEGARRAGEGRGAKGTKRKRVSELQPLAFSHQPWLEHWLGHSESAIHPSSLILHPFLDAPIKGFLAQFLYSNWRAKKTE